MKVVGPIVLAALAAGCVSPGTAPPGDAAASLAAAESAFAAQSVREGMRAAFLAHFADDGVMVQGGWTNAIAHLAPRASPPIVLDWRPAYVEVPASGELGLSTGPWKVSDPANPGEKPAYGQFVSVWRRAAGGPWKVEVDIGIAHPQPALWDEALRATTVEGGGTPPESIETAEAGFAREALRDGARAAYGRHASATVRIYRSGASPVLGRQAALASSAAGEGPFTWTAERIETARSGDFGYARGSYAEASAPGVALGQYLRIWRLESGAWRVALDVTAPLHR